MRALAACPPYAPLHARGGRGRRAGISLAAQLVAAIVITTLLAGGVVGAVVIQNARATVRDAILVRSLASAELAAELVADHVENAEAASRELADRPGLRELIGRSAFDAASPDLEHFLGANLSVANVSLVDLEGTVRATGNTDKSGVGQVNSADRDWFREVVRTGRPYLGEAAVGRVAGKPRIAYGVPLIDDAGKLGGVMVASISLDELSNAIVHVDAGHNARTNLDDLEHKVTLASAEPSRILQPMSARNAAVERLLRGERGTMENVTSRGEETLAAYTLVPGLPWGILIQQPSADAFAPVDEMVGRTVGLVLLAVLLAGSIGVALALSIARPLRRLQAAANAMAIGDLTRRAAVDRGDEIGELGQAFDHMADQLQRMVHELEATAEHANGLAVLAEQREARLQRESERLLALHNASSVLAAQTAEPDAVLEEVVRSAVSLIGASSGSLYRWDPEAELLRCVHNFRVAETHRTVDSPPGKGLAGQTFSRRIPIIVNDYPAWEAAIDSAHVGGMRAGMGIPLVRGGQCLGVLILRSYDDQTIQFTEEDARLAALFADQAAAALFTAETLEQQRYTAYHDTLTGLPNRALLRDRLQNAIEAATRSGGSLALFLLDLNGFKEVNDTLGHVAGDGLLQEVARRLSASLRVSDTVARLGGDEFAVVLPGADAEAASSAARKLLAELTHPYVHEQQPIDIGASLGIAVFPEHGDDPAALLRRADIAMYVAKRSGSEYAIYSSDQDQHSPDRLTQVSDLRLGIERDELVLYFQPKVDVRTGRAVGAEALVRWQHPRRGLVAPDHFIPLAEQAGLIKPLTRWVLRAALTQCRDWQRVGIHLPVAVNLSMHDLRDPELPRTLSDLLTELGVPASLLKLEITESTIMADPERTQDVLARLRALGLQVAIDDFGAGYSSLGYLKRLPVDALKIDRCFVRDLANDPSDRAIVHSAIDLGHNLGLLVIAEGVEDQASLDVLNHLNCDMAQGYYLSRPLPPADFEHWLQSARKDSDGLKKAA